MDLYQIVVLTGAKIPSNFSFPYIEVYRMGVGSRMCRTAPLQEAVHTTSEGSLLDSCKAVVLVLPQWWEDMLREVNLVLEGWGFTLDSALLRWA